MQWSSFAKPFPTTTTTTTQQQPLLEYTPLEDDATQEYHGRGLVASRGENEEPLLHDASLLQVIDQRMSVRTFTEDPIDLEIVYHALRVARLAPSAGNRQAYQVVLVRSAVQKQALARAAIEQEWIANAPVVLVFLADEERSGHKFHDRGRTLYAIQDTTIAAAYTQLALEAAGLSSCWVGAFREEAVADIVGASRHSREEDKSSWNYAMGDDDDDDETVQSLADDSVLRPVVIMPIGIGATEEEERPRRHHRRSIREFVHHDCIGSAASKKKKHQYCNGPPAGSGSHRAKPSSQNHHHHSKRTKSSTNVPSSESKTKANDNLDGATGLEGMPVKDEPRL